MRDVVPHTTDTVPRGTDGNDALLTRRADDDVPRGTLQTVPILEFGFAVRRRGPKHARYGRSTWNTLSTGYSTDPTMFHVKHLAPTFGLC